MSEDKKEEAVEKKDSKDPYQKYKDFQWNDKDAFKNGPVGDASRSCRDILCLIIFLVFICGCVVVAIFAFKDGNPDLILYPYDEDSNQCGKGDLLNFPFLYFYETLENLQNFELSNITNSICIDVCPNVTFPESDTSITVKCKPTGNNPLCKIDKKNYYRSQGILNRLCIPMEEPDKKPETKEIDGELWVKLSDINKSANGLFNQAFFSGDKLVTWMGDLFKTWPIILGSLGWSFVLGLVFLLLVRFCAGFIIYLSIILILGCLIALGIFFHLKSDLYTSVDDSIYYTSMVALAWTCYGLALIWLIIILFMCNRIRLAVGLMKATAKYIHNNCLIVLVPLFFFLFTGAFYTYWIFCSVFLYSTGELDKNSTIIASINWSNQTRYSWWFHLFALLYINEMINAVSEFVYASSACIWYFTHEKGGGEKPIRTSFKRAFRYHFGSLAFGALIIAIIRFIMLWMEYIKKKLDKTIAKNSKVGKIYKCLICCCQCCMNCIARTMEFINRHAFIQIALKGDNFCVAAWEGFGIVIRNLGRFSTLFLIGGFFNFFGTIFIASSSGVIGYLVITEVPYFSTEINSPILPTFVMVMIGLIIGKICMSVFGTSADALMHSFLLDEELNKGQPKSYPELQKFMSDER